MAARRVKGAKRKWRTSAAEAVFMFNHRGRDSSLVLGHEGGTVHERTPHQEPGVAVQTTSRCVGLHTHRNSERFFSCGRNPGQDQEQQQQHC